MPGQIAVNPPARVVRIERKHKVFLAGVVAGSFGVSISGFCGLKLLVFGLPDVSSGCFHAVVAEAESQSNVVVIQRR